MPSASSGSDDTVRAMRHRLRNDLQTLASLCRLGRRRADGDTLAAAFPQWLETLAALYDLPAPPSEDAAVALRPLAESLARRAGSRVAVTGNAEVPAASLLAVALGISGLLAFARNAAGPAGDIRMEINGGIRATFPAATDTLEAEAPLALDLAAAALGGRVSQSRSGGQMTIALTFPCP